MNPLRARLLYVWDVLVLLKPYTLKRSHTASFFFLFSSYLKPSYRSLLNNKLHTSLILFGLTTSIAAFILLVMYVDDELKYDRHYDKAERIYKITSEVSSATANSLIVGTDGYLGQRLEEFFPEVEESVEMVKLPGKTLIQYEEKTFSEESLYRAERSYFNIFNHSWIEGAPSTALSSPKKILLTQKLAEKYFGRETALNKTVKIGPNDFTVAGVIRNLPSHTDLKFDALLSTDYEYLAETDYWCITFILFNSKMNPGIFEKKMNEINEQNLQNEVAGSDASFLYRMEALPDVHFGKQKIFDTPKSSRSNIYIFSIIAFFILFIASINYANLAMVQAFKRNTEAGIRKIMGALPSQLAKQFLLESFMVCSTSFILGGSLAFLLLGFLNQLTGKQLSPSQFLNFPLFSILLLVIIFMSLLAGGYPALLVSSAKPINALRGHDRIIKKNRFRNVLIVFQFTASIVLIICTEIVYDQWNLLTQTNPGFKKEQVLVIDVPTDKSLVPLLQGMKNDLQTLPFVKRISSVGYNSLPTSSMDLDGYEVEYNGENVTRIFNNITVDENYLDLLEIEVKKGRNFRAQDIESNENYILINESLVAAMGWDHPLNETLYENSEAYQVAGVVKDFHFNSLHKIIEPMVIHSNPGRPEKLMVRLNEANFQTLQTLEEHWKKIMESPFEAEFLDSYFNHQYRNEKTMQQVLQYFSTFTLIIACLGLFGLVAISTVQKTKEFGIRKVLGAKFPNIAFLVVKEFIVLVALAAVFALPIAWWSITLWLTEFSYKTILTVSDFALPVLVTFFIAILSMAYHTVKASLTNPVDSIKHG